MRLPATQRTFYLAYQVTKDRPFSNKGDNWQTLFLSGDCVDLMLSTNAASGLHSDPAPGDIRLLFSMYQGKPIAVLYRPTVPGTFAAGSTDGREDRQHPAAVFGEGVDCAKREFVCG